MAESAKKDNQSTYSSKEGSNSPSMGLPSKLILVASTHLKCCSSSSLYNSEFMSIVIFMLVWSPWQSKRDTGQEEQGSVRKCERQQNLDCNDPPQVSEEVVDYIISQNKQRRTPCRLLARPTFFIRANIAAQRVMISPYVLKFPPATYPCQRQACQSLGSIPPWSRRTHPLRKQ